MRSFVSSILLFVFFTVGSFNNTYSQTDTVYNNGSVWSISFIRANVNSVDDYLKGLKSTWEASYKGALNQGLIKSYKIFLGSASNEEDFNIILLVEYENMAALDPDPIKDKKWDAIDQKIKDSMKENYQKTIANYENIRQFFGEKVMREIYLK